MADTTMPHVDAVIVGFGWTGAIMAKELTEAGLKVVALERGAFRDTYPEGAYPSSMDELAHLQRFKLFQDISTSSFTFRHGVNDASVPYRQIGMFKPGTGVGGAGLHWSGQQWRVLPDELNMRAHYEKAYGKSFIPEDMSLQSWGVSYDELEPYFDLTEKVFGTSGQAYSVKGEPLGKGGNPFDAWRSDNFPLPPQKSPYTSHLFGKAAAEVGLHPFVEPSANLSQSYTNTYGCQMGACTFCGFCSGFSCYNYSKSSPNVCILPALNRVANFELRANCEVLRVDLTADKGHATGVTYVTPDGKTVHQPADLVIVGTFAYNNARLLLLSGIGTPYDPKTNTGAVGKNLCYQMMSTVRMFYEPGKNTNPFIGAGGTGTAVDDYNGTHYDHGPLGFVGGSPVWCNPAGVKPISGIPTPDGTPSWGEAWKKSVKDSYLNTVSFDVHGANMAYRDCYLDLDPDYKDQWGQALLRFTFDWHDNDIRMSRYVTGQMLEVAKAMAPKATQVWLKKPGEHLDMRPYQTTHWAGGSIMGEDPKTSVVNRYLQCWDVPNVFCVGSGVFAQGIGYNPTGLVCALAYWSARAIRNDYLKNPRKLVDA